MLRERLERRYLNLCKYANDGLEADSTSDGSPNAVTVMENQENEYNRYIGSKVQDAIIANMQDLLRPEKKSTINLAREKLGQVRDFYKSNPYAGYGTAALGGGILGSLLAGKGNRMLGATIGALSLALANYARRKYTYGNSVKF